MFKTVTSKVVPLNLRDVDTDMIIPAQYLTGVTREGYGENLFRRLRDQDQNFPFNLKKYGTAKILVADDNFGCGSSREHAVWALKAWGIDVVICKSFADIFFNNAGKNALLLVRLEPQVVDSFLRQASESELVLTVSLEQQLVTDEHNQQYRFEYDSFRKHCLLNGLNDFDYIRSHKVEIDQYMTKREETFYFSTLKANHE